MAMKTMAMVFAAGLGTRLYPLTADRPKALVEIQGKTLLDTVVERIAAAGIHEIVVNIHHFSNLMRDYIQHHDFPARILISDESDGLLDTAGGLKFAEPLLRDADQILLHNVDILTDLDLCALMQTHVQSGALATLAVRRRDTSRYFLFRQDDLRLCGWKNVKTGEVKQSLSAENLLPLAFSGVHCVRREILDMIPSGQKLSVTPLYLQLAAHYRVQGFLHQQDTWMDVGKYDDLLTKGLLTAR